MVKQRLYTKNKRGVIEMEVYEDDQYFEVYFDQYCNKCKYKNCTKYEDPCEECLDNPVNLNSHKPINFEEIKK